MKKRARHLAKAHLLVAAAFGLVGCRWGYELLDDGALGALGGASSAGSGGASSNTGGTASSGTGGTTGLGGAGAFTPSATCVTDTYDAHDYSFCGDRRSWYEAELECAARSSKLARIDDSAENQWVRDTAHTHHTIGNEEMWIGANDLATNGEWAWPDGAVFWSGDLNGTPQNSLYNNWATGEPRITDEHCVGIIMNGQPTWNDAFCTLERLFVCEDY